MIENLKNYEIVSFALEGVLTDELDGTENPLKEQMQKLCKDLVNQGKKVIIYTKRYERSDNKHLTPNNKSEYKEGFDFAQTLNVGNVVFTNRNNFYHYMTNNARHCHINCSPYESLLLNKYKPSIVTININKEIWA